MNFVKTFLNDSSMNESSRLRNRKNVNYCLDTMFEEGEQEETVNKRTVANDEDYEPELELKVCVFNINKGHNEDMLSKCPTLKEYMEFIDEIRKRKDAGRTDSRKR